MFCNNCHLRSLALAVTGLASSSWAIAQCEAVFANPWGNDPNAIAPVNDAIITAGGIRLTPDEEGKWGAAWATQRGSLRNGFDCMFSFEVSGASGAFGAGDGFAFLVQNHPAGPNAVGGGGSDLGYGGMQNAIAVEFDTFFFQDEFTADHVSVQTMDENGYLFPMDSQSLGHAQLPMDINDAGELWAYVRYRPGSLRVQVEGQTLIDVVADLEDLGGFSALDIDGCGMVGFTGATGGASSEHLISNWSFGDTADCQSMDLFGFVSSESFVVGDRGVFRMVPMGSGPWSFEWRLNGTPLVNGGAISGADTPFLVIDPIGPEHHGQIDYSVSNNCSGVGTGFFLSVEPACSGDLNDDGQISLPDLTILLANFGTPGGATPHQGDLNFDGAVDLGDLAQLLAFFGSSC